MDPRLSDLRSVLSLPTQKLPGRHGRPVPNLAVLLRPFGGATPTGLSRALPGLLSAVDAARGSGSGARVVIRRRLTRGAQLVLTATHRKSGDDLVLELRNGALRARFGTSAPSQGARVAHAAGLVGTGLAVDECPTGAGVVKGHLVSETHASMAVTGSVSVEVTIRTRTETIGKVADDGKLDTLDIGHHDDVILTLSGSFLDEDVAGSTSVPVTRDSQVDMRTGRHDNALGALGYVELMPGAAGLGGLGVAAAQVAAPFAQDSYKRVLADAMATYRDNELKWNIANHCAHLEVDPAGFPTGVNPGATGTITAVLTSALHEPVPAGTLSATTSLGSVAPATSRTDGGGRSVLGWSAGAQGIRTVVSTTLDVVSRAGRASTDWHADGADRAPRTLEGTISGTASSDGEYTGTFTYSGSVTFTNTTASEGVWDYTLTAADIRWTADLTTVDYPIPGCRLTGSGTIVADPTRDQSDLYLADLRDSSGKWEYHSRMWLGTTTGTDLVVATGQCPPDPDPSDPYPYDLTLAGNGGIWGMPTGGEPSDHAWGSAGQQQSDGPRALAGTATDTHNGWITTRTWNLVGSGVAGT